MLSDRLQRQVDRLLDQAEEAIGRRDWESVRESAEAVLRVDPQNPDAAGYLAMAGVKGRDQPTRPHRAHPASRRRLNPPPLGMGATR